VSSSMAIDEDTHGQGRNRFMHERSRSNEARQRAFMMRCLIEKT